MPNSYGVFKSHVGFANEASFGSTAAAVQVSIPFLDYSYTDDQGLVYDEGGRSKASKLYAVYAGVQQGAWSGTAPYYPNECYRFFHRVLGTDTVGTTSGLYTHTLTLADLPASDSIFDFFGSTLGDRAFSGAQCEKVGFKFDRASGLATIKPTYKSAAPSTGPGAESSPNYGTDLAMRGYEGVFSVAGSTRATLLTYELMLSRDVDLIFAGNNSQRPASVEVGNFDVTGKISFYGSTDQPYVDYRANTQQAVEVVLRESSGVTGTSGGQWLDLLMTKCVFTKVTPDRSGKFLRYEAEFRGIHNATDGGPIQILCTVATSSALT